jgi:hypothetical protein
MQCYHCAREVQGTSHTQKTYRVDYYLLHTGHGQWEYFLNLKPDTPPLRYLKLIQPIDVLTCIQCYARAEIRQLLDDDFTGRRSLLTEDGEKVRGRILRADQ